MAKEETRDTKRSAQVAIDHEINKYRADYSTALRFTYEFDRDKKPFLVTAMYHDDKFTYIQASPQETPALYEIKDGQPSLVSYEYRDGVYVAAKVLDRGYLRIGKVKQTFKREE